MNLLRLLNYDDLLLLSFFEQGYSQTEAAKHLSLTQPAVSQRVKKMESVFGAPLFRKVGRNVQLTLSAKELCQRASAAVEIMESASPQGRSLSLTIGTRAEVGLSWLGPALQRLRKTNPEYMFHCHFGSGEEILQQLGIGSLDAVLTSAPLARKGFEAIDVAKETYCFVAKNEIASQVRSLEDLAKQTFIEHDRSFPFLRYVDGEIRAKLHFDDVWFLGSSVLMMQAVAKGHGVGIVPQYLADPYLKKSSIRKLKLNIPLGHDHFRLIYSKRRNIGNAIVTLADELKRTGLRP